MKLIGVIVRRRVLGKHLAFCHVQRRQETITEQPLQQDDDVNVLQLLQENDNQQQQQEHDDGVDGGEDADDIVRVAFRRSSDAWDLTRDDTFPTKVSRLPYGATVLMELKSPPYQKQQPQDYWEVCSWQILVHPDVLAQTTSAVEMDMDMDKKKNSNKNIAQNNNDDQNKVIVSVPAYLRARGEMYMDLHPEKRPKKIKSKLQQQQPSTMTMELNPHGDNAQAKCQRAKVFCKWLLETFGPEIMMQNTSCNSTTTTTSSSRCATVLDVASGKGQLSIELACSGPVPGGGVRCIMVDPMIRGQRHDPTTTTKRTTSCSVAATTNTDKDDSLQILGKRARKRILKAGGLMPVFLPAHFDATQFVEKHGNVLQNCALLVGLHPDQCTEAIVDVALRYQKSFAIVPCCVFGDLFPVRMLQQRQPGDRMVPVRTYDQFLQYLREKDPRIQQATLPVCGKNQVLYLQQQQ